LLILDIFNFESLRVEALLLELILVHLFFLFFISFLPQPTNHLHLFNLNIKNINQLRKIKMRVFRLDRRLKYEAVGRSIGVELD